MSKKIKSGTLYRYSEIRAADINKDDRTVELSFSSEDPYERYFGIEILDHEKSSVDLKRLNSGGALLLDHNPGKQIGVIEKSIIDETDKKGRAVVRFSRSDLGEEIYQDVLDGIRKNVSVGYRVNKMVLEEETDDKEIYRVTKWMPLEVSIVPVPADITVGVGRSENDDLYDIEIENSKAQEKAECVKITLLV